MAKDQHANIMLDIECAGLPHSSNPAIIEIGAVYFDFNTGEELSCFSTPINLKSCIDKGLPNH